jgi:HEAT repeat protein
VPLLLLLPGIASGQGSESVEDLISQLASPQVAVRHRAVIALKDRGINEETVIKGLVGRLQDVEEAAYVRSSAAYTLGVIGADTEEVVEQLIKALRADDEEVRFNAAAALGELGAKEQYVNSHVLDAIEPLISTLETDPSINVRQEAAGALAEIGTKAKQASSLVVPHLMRAVNVQLDELKARDSEYKQLKDNDPRLYKLKDELAQLHQKAALGLGRMGSEAKEAIPSLVRVLKDKDDPIVRRWAAEALGKISLEPKIAIPSLVEVIRDDPNNPVRISAARSIVALCNAVGSAKDRNAVEVLRNALRDMPRTPETPTNETEKAISQAARSVSTTLDYLELLGRPRFLKFVEDYLLLMLAVILHLTLLLLVLALLKIRPLWILWVNEVLTRVTESIPLPKFNIIKLPVQYVLWFGFFHFNSRVLDAWVDKYLEKAGDVFSKNPTVSQREIYVSVPVVLGGQSLHRLTARDVQPLFDRSISHLLISGDGGAGKTSLACRLGKWAMAQEREKRLCSSHPMLPILLEQKLAAAPSGDAKISLLHVIQKQLRILIEEEEAASIDLVRHLLKHRRVLLIVDSLSEMTPASRANLTSSISETPVNAVIITSRTSEHPGELQPMIVSPIRIGGDTLASFMTDYLEFKDKRRLFRDPEFFDACRKLSLMGGERGITCMLARLFVDQLVAAKEGMATDKLPDNVPGVMRNYLYIENRRVPDAIDSEVLMVAAKALAWASVEANLYPQPVSYKNALAALRRKEVVEELYELGYPNMDEGGRGSVIKYLENRLMVIKTFEGNHGSLGFTLDPLAEYLASLHLIALYRDDTAAWDRLLHKAKEQQSVSAAVEGFLIVLHDCCQCVGAESNVPASVETELAKLIETKLGEGEAEGADQPS